MAQDYTKQGFPDTGEGHITMYGLCPYSITQGRWTPLNNAVYSMYTLLYNVTNALNDQLSYYVWLSKGTYSLDMWQTSGAMGICTYYLDGVSLGSLDWYNASDIYGSKKTIVSIAVTQSKRYIFSIKITGHTTTSNYYAYIHSFAFYRTA